MEDSSRVCLIMDPARLRVSGIGFVEGLGFKALGLFRA